MNPIRKFFISVACLASMAAHAQWQWIDKDGHKVFSDRAPSADVLEKNILKRPGGRATGTPVPLVADDIAKPRPAMAASAPKLSGVDNELAEKKQKAEEAEAAKRKAEEDKLAKTRVENCARAKQAKASFDSGVRIARTNAKGEREVLDEAARAVEINRIQSILESECKSASKP